MRQEKALQRYDDTESEISQLLSRHSNETHVLRERLRRTQDRERAAERRLKDSEEQLQRSQATITRLKKLVDQRDLGTKDELSRRLEEEQARAQVAEHKIKVCLILIMPKKFLKLHFVNRFHFCVCQRSWSVAWSSSTAATSDSWLQKRRRPSVPRRRSGFCKKS